MHEQRSRARKSASWQSQYFFETATATAAATASTATDCRSAAAAVWRGPAVLPRGRHWRRRYSHRAAWCVPVILRNTCSPQSRCRIITAALFFIASSCHSSFVARPLAQHSFSRLSTPSTTPRTGAGIGKASNLRFMQAVRAVDTRRDYSIIIDKSGSMAGGRWRDVRVLQTVNTWDCCCLSARLF